MGETGRLRHGQGVAYTADNNVAVSDNGLVGFVPPLRPTLNFGDADGFVRPRNQSDERRWGIVQWSVDLTRAPGEELVVKSDRGEVFEGPLPLGNSIADNVAARGFFDDDVPGLVTGTSEGWDEDGVFDLSVAWTGFVCWGTGHPPGPLARCGATVPPGGPGAEAAMARATSDTGAALGNGHQPRLMCHAVTGAGHPLPGHRARVRSIISLSSSSVGSLLSCSGPPAPGRRLAVTRSRSAGVSVPLSSSAVACARSRSCSIPIRRHPLARRRRPRLPSRC